MLSKQFHLFYQFSCLMNLQTLQSFRWLTLFLIQQFCNRRHLKHVDTNIENLYKWGNFLLKTVENIVAKVEIARFEQFLLLSQCFSKVACCRGVRKHLYGGKGWEYTRIFTTWSFNPFPHKNAFEGHYRRTFL